MRGRLLFPKVAGISLALFLPSAGVCQQIVDQPYVTLLELNDTDYSRNELKSLRSDIQEERSKLIDGCKKEEARLKEQRDAAQRKLRNLNATRATAETRAGLHRIVEASEEPLRKTRLECEPTVSAAFEIKRTKLRVAKDWPRRREEILRSIDQGRARK